MLRQLMPASSVRHNPPPVYPAKYVIGCVGMPAAVLARPPRHGPTLRHCSARKAAVSGVAATDGAAVPVTAALRRCAAAEPDIVTTANAMRHVGTDR